MKRKQHVAIHSSHDTEVLENWMLEAWIDEGWEVKSVNISSSFDPSAGENGLLIHTICAIVQTDRPEAKRSGWV